MLQRIRKGDYGYIQKKKKQVACRTALYFVLSAALFCLGYLTTGTKKNLLTVVAVLGLLPASKSLVNLVMFLRARGCSAEAYEVLAPLAKHLLPMYDLYFTSYEKNFAISQLVVYEKLILGYTEDARCDTDACVEHLTLMLTQAGHKGRTITITNDREKYANMLQALDHKAQEDSDDADGERNDAVRITLYEITL